MKKTVILLLGVFILLFSVAVGLNKSQASAEGKSDFVKGEILVKFKEGIDPGKVDRVHRQLGGEVKEIIPGINVQVIAVKHGVGEAVSAYARNSNVEYVEPNYIAEVLEAEYHPSDEYFMAGKQWALHNTGQVFDDKRGLSGSYDKDVDAPEAWAVAKSSASFAVAVLDTGINLTHEDLQSKIMDKEDFSGSSSGVEDMYGHGTHVAGIVAALTDNDPENDGTGIGVAGTGFNSSLMAGKVCNDSGSCAYSWVANGITWAADNGAKVVNMSLGGPRKSKTLERAVNYAWDGGAVLVAAAGNSNNPSPTYPAKYKNVISVAATDEDDNKASFSSYGDWVDVAAPGVNIYSTFPNHDFVLRDKYGRSYNYDYGSGTSMSTPIVAGIAGLVWSTEYGKSSQAVRDRIEQTADSIPGTGSYWIWGRVNACNAVGGNCSGEPSSIPTPTLGEGCGDKYCAGVDSGEDCFTCPEDCRCAGRNCSNACCGDGICNGENIHNCPVDCGGS